MRKQRGAWWLRISRTEVCSLLFTGITAPGPESKPRTDPGHQISLCSRHVRAAGTGKRSLTVQYLDVQRDEGDQAVVFDELY